MNLEEGEKQTMSGSPEGSASNGNEKSVGKQQEAPLNPDSSEHPAKKMKRGKYISRAWYVYINAVSI